MNATEILPTPENLRRIRSETGLSQVKFAELVSLGAFTRVSEWENGAKPIDPIRWELMLVKLDLHPEYGPRTRRSPLPA